MSIIEWVFVVGSALIIIMVLGIVFFGGRLIKISQQIKRLPVRQIKNKKKKRVVAIKRQKLLKKRKSALLNFLSSFFLAVLFSCIIIYISYYQALNLTTDDSNSVVQGYYLLRDFQTQLENVKEQSDDAETIQKNIRYLATSMASYGTKKASNVNSKEGQLILNRYYNSITQLGMNASTQTKNFYGNEQIVDDFLEDITRVQNYEKVAFSYYKVDESAFSE